MSLSVQTNFVMHHIHRHFFDAQALFQHQRMKTDLVHANEGFGRSFKFDER